MTLLDQRDIDKLNEITQSSAEKTILYMRLLTGPFIKQCKTFDDIKKLSEFAYYISRFKMMSKQDYSDYVDQLTVVGFILFPSDQPKNKV